MYVYEDFPHYKEGIYSQVWGQYKGNHAICIVGYNTSGYTDYWICKNSWGADWGENGFFMIKMGECGIETIANYYMSGAILPLAPIAPSNLNASAINDTQVNLSWKDNSSNEGGFEIQRKKAGGTFSTIASVGGDVTSYKDKNVSGETTYYYQVRAYNAGGNSAFSNSACAKTTSCYYCGEGLVMNLTTDSKIVTLGERVTYTYKLKNKGNLDLTVIELSDDKLRIIAKEFTLKKGETKSVTKIATLNETTTNFAEAKAKYRLKDEIIHVKAHACATVEVRNSSEK